MSTSKPRVLVVSDVLQLSSHLERLNVSDLVDLEWVDPADAAGIEAKISTVEIILADPLPIAPFIHLATKLQWMQSTWAGVDALFKRSKPPIKTNYQLTRLAAVFGPSMAEYVIGHIIARERNIVQLNRQHERHVWDVDPAHRMYRELNSLTIGIMGFGLIGKEVARACKAFGATVWALCSLRTSQSADKLADKIFDSTSPLSAFLGGVDYLVNILPSTPRTTGLLNGDVLTACKRGCVFINVGRGDIVDEDTLVQAIQQQWLAGAILDVVPEEPLPSHSRLWELPGVLITPHIAAVSFPHQVAEQFVSNLRRFLVGQPLEHVVDFTKGY